MFYNYENSSEGGNNPWSFIFFNTIAYLLTLNERLQSTSRQGVERGKLRFDILIGRLMRCRSSCEYLTGDRILNVVRVPVKWRSVALFFFSPRLWTHAFADPVRQTQWERQFLHFLHAANWIIQTAFSRIPRWALDSSRFLSYFRRNWRRLIDDQAI